MKLNYGVGPGGMQIGVDWDNGRALQLVVPPDTYRIIERAGGDA
jgi:hypothetical protein